MTKIMQTKTKAQPNQTTPITKDSIENLMTAKEDEVITSYRMNKKLHEELKQKLKSSGHTFHEFVEVCAKLYVGNK